LTICEELNICLWGFKDNKSSIISFNQMYRPISNIISMKNVLLVAFKPCDTQVFRYDQELEDLVHIKTDTTFEHESEITDVDTFPEKNLFISGSMDGFVKVWNAKKEMIREIKFPEPVYSVSFLNKDCDILVGHLGKVSTVSHKDYVPYEIAKLYQPNAEDVNTFFLRKRTRADSDLFVQLKMKDDELKR
jgi:WD40 repeat protein